LLSLFLQFSTHEEFISKTDPIFLILLEGVTDLNQKNCLHLVCEITGIYYRLRENDMEIWDKYKP